MYDPSIGRWLEEDPVGMTDDVNPYRYVGNDPLNNLDPSGLSRMDARDLLDGRQEVYYIQTNWAGRAAYYGGSLGIGWLYNRFVADQDMFEERPVFIGIYDPLTGNVQRGNNYVGVERVRGEAESSFGGRPDWNAFFTENAIDFAARNQQQGLAWRVLFGVNLDNDCVRNAGLLRELGFDVALGMAPALGARQSHLNPQKTLRGS